MSSVGPDSNYPITCIVHVTVRKMVLVVAHIIHCTELDLDGM